jgi:phosphopantetheine adenylyltransferase
MQDFKPDIKVMFIMCDKDFEHISSSSIRILESFRKGSSEKYVIC